MIEVYFSCDIEADGPIPGPNSMLSLGCAAFLRPRQLLGTFSANLWCLEGAVQDEDTMTFWEKNPEAYRRTRENLCEPATAMREFVTWVGDRCADVGSAAKPVFVGWPATYDFMFVYWYLMRFTGASPFKHSGFCIKTAASVKTGKAFRRIGKRSLPDAWKGPEKHTHVAVDDAIEQGWLFCRMMEDS